MFYVSIIDHTAKRVLYEDTYATKPEADLRASRLEGHIVHPLGDAEIIEGHKYTVHNAEAPFSFPKVGKHDQSGA